MDQKRAPSRGVLSLGHFWGIPFGMHVSVFLLGAVLTLILGGQGLGVALLCVVLGAVSLVAHELGHALAARRLGYHASVVLRAFQSVTTLRERLQPEHEALMALAGPAVTALLVVLFRGVTLLGSGTLLALIGQRLAFFNLLLLGVSLLPALPQDAGRAIRGALTRHRGERAAVELVGRTGLAATAILALFAIWLRVPLLGLLAMALMTGTIFSTRAEMAKLATATALVEAAMLRQFKRLSPGDTLGEVARQLVGSGQHDFPVVQGDEVLGILRGSFLIQGLPPKRRAAYVAETMDREVAWAEAMEPLSPILARVKEGERLPILVRQEGRLVGMLTARSLQEFTTMKMLEETD